MMIEDAIMNQDFDDEYEDNKSLMWRLKMLEELGLGCDDDDDED